VPRALRVLKATKAHKALQVQLVF
jgi:hypothetical protein